MPSPFSLSSGIISATFCCFVLCNSSSICSGRMGTPTTEPIKSGRHINRVRNRCFIDTRSSGIRRARSRDHSLRTRPNRVNSGCATRRRSNHTPRAFGGAREATTERKGYAGTLPHSDSRHKGAMMTAATKSNSGRRMAKNNPAGTGVSAANNTARRQPKATSRCMENMVTT